MTHQKYDDKIIFFLMENAMKSSGGKTDNKTSLPHPLFTLSTTINFKPWSEAGNRFKRI